MGKKAYRLAAIWTTALLVTALPLWADNDPAQEAETEDAFHEVIVVTATATEQSAGELPYSVEALETPELSLKRTLIDVG